MRIQTKMLLIVSIMGMQMYLSLNCVDYYHIIIIAYNIKIVLFFTMIIL